MLPCIIGRSLDRGRSHCCFFNLQVGTASGVGVWACCRPAHLHPLPQEELGMGLLPQAQRRHGCYGVSQDEACVARGGWLWDSGTGRERGLDAEKRIERGRETRGGRQKTTHRRPLTVPAFITSRNDRSFLSTPVPPSTPRFQTQPPGTRRTRRVASSSSHRCGASPTMSAPWIRSRMQLRTLRLCRASAEAPLSAAQVARFDLRLTVDGVCMRVYVCVPVVLHESVDLPLMNGTHSFVCRNYTCTHTHSTQA